MDGNFRKLLLVVMEFNSKFVLIYYFKFPFFSNACSKHLAATPAVPDRNDSMRLR